MEILRAVVAPVFKSGHLAAASLDMLLSVAVPSASLFVSLSSCSRPSMQLRRSRAASSPFARLSSHMFSHCDTSQMKKKKKKENTRHEPRSGDPVRPPWLCSSLISPSCEGSSDASALTSLLNSAPSTWRHAALQQRPPPAALHAGGYCGITTPLLLRLARRPELPAAAKNIAESPDLLAVKGRRPLVTDCHVIDSSLQ